MFILYLFYYINTTVRKRNRQINFDNIKKFWFQLQSFNKNSYFRFGSVSISLSDLLNGKWCSILMFQQQPSTKHSPSLILCAKYLIFGMSMIKSVLWQTPKESNLPRRLRVSKLKLLIAGQWKENIEFAMWQEDQLKCKVSNGILLPKLFWPSMRKNCSSKAENLQKFWDR